MNRNDSNWPVIQAAVFRFLAKFHLHVHPRDTVLKAKFFRHRKAFEALRSMLEQDSFLGYVSDKKFRTVNDVVWQRNANSYLENQRWDEYRRSLKELGVMAVSHVGQTITMRVSNAGTSSKGFAWRPHHTCLVDSLEDYPITDKYHAHIKLDDQWYTYYGWEL